MKQNDRSPVAPITSDSNRASISPTEAQVIALLDRVFFRRATTLDLIAELEWAQSNLTADPEGADYWALELASVQDEVERRQRKPQYTVSESSRITKAIVEDIKSRVNIVELIGRDLMLIGPWSDKRHKAICPFHDDHTPSFAVYPDGRYHCFGCGAHGDAVQWLMASKSMTFRDAITQLATETGVALGDTGTATA